MRLAIHLAAVWLLSSTAYATSLSQFTPAVTNLPIGCEVIYKQDIIGCTNADFGGSHQCSPGCVRALQALTPEIQIACKSVKIGGNNIINAYLSNAGPASVCANAGQVLASAGTSSTAPSSTSASSTSSAASSTATSSTTSSVTPTSSSIAASSTTTTATEASSSTTSSLMASSSSAASTSSAATAKSTSNADIQTGVNDGSGGGSPFDSPGNVNSAASTVAFPQLPMLMLAMLLVLI